MKSILLTTLIFLGITLSHLSLAEYQMNSGHWYEQDIRVEIVSIEEAENSGILKLSGDCTYCGQELRFSEDTRLKTPFYDGYMDVKVLEEQKFAKATVKMSTHLMKVSAIYYVNFEH